MRSRIGRLLLALLFCGWAWSADAAWAFVSATAHAGDTSVSKSVTSGNLLLFIHFDDSGTTTVSISDGVNTWHAWGASPVSGSVAAQAWWAIAASTASITVTITGAGGTGFDGNALGEYSGNAGGTPTDGSASNSNNGSTATDGDVTGSMTTGTDGDLVVSCIVDASTNPTSQEFAGGTGFTRRGTFSNDPAGTTSDSFACEDKVQTTHGAINPSWTGANTDSYQGIGAAFKVSAGAAACSPSLASTGAGACE